MASDHQHNPDPNVNAAALYPHRRAARISYRSPSRRTAAGLICDGRGVASGIGEPVRMPKCIGRSRASGYRTCRPLTVIA
jgi:hypothetical protein